MPLKSSFLRSLRQWHRSSVTSLLLLALVTLFGTFAGAAVPVTLAPVPKLQFFDASGRPLAFGCVFAYQSGTTTPLTTYTDYTGSVANSNPVVLTAGGFAGSGSGGIWLQAGQAYTLKVVAAGGVNCASGVTQFTVDGIGGGLTILTSVVTYSATPSFPIQAEIQLFTITLTGNAVAQPLTAVGIIPPAHLIFQITQDGAGGHTFTWPSNSIGGAPIGLGINQVTTQEFIWNGTNATAIGPAITGTGPALSAGSLTLSGQLTSTLATGTAPFVIASTTKVVNLNVDQVDGFDWAIPGAIGSTTPNTAAVTTLVVGGSQPQTSVQGGGTDVKLLSASTVAASSPIGCTDAAGGFTTTCTGFGPTFAPQRITLGSPVTINATTQTTILTKSVTFPSTPGTYRASLSYNAWVTAGGNHCAAEVYDHTNTLAFASSGQDANGVGYMGLAGAEITSQTYAASATVSFTLEVECNNGAGGLVGATVDMNGGALFAMSPKEATYLSITPVLSN